MLRKIVVLAVPGLAPFEFGVLCEVFGIDRTQDGAPPFDFHVAAAEPGVLPFRHGMSLTVTEDLTVAADADLVAAPAYRWPTVDPRILDTLRAAHARGAWVLSVCSGAFLLGRARLLDGRRSTTHWMYTDQLQREFPATRVDPGVLFTDEDRIVTSAGTASGIDASLHIVREELGAGVANIIARRMVVPPQRDGGQSQYIATPVVECRDDSLAGLLAWLEEHFAEESSVDDLARRALMSPRTFARRFRAETGTTPAAWLNRLRLARAQLLLESSDLTVDRIARDVGFGQGAVLRRHFATTLRTTPQAYRRRFSTV